MSAHDTLFESHRIEEIKKILGLENDNVQIGIIPEEYCDVEPYCNYKAVFQKDNNAIFIHLNSWMFNFKM